MEYEDKQPSHYPADGANEYGDEVDGDARRENDVRQKDEHYPEESVDDEPHR